MFFFFAVFFSVLFSLSSCFNCTTSFDCEYNGNCINSLCNCYSGWIGDTCGTLNLTIAPYPNYGIWPLSASHDTETCYSWGFTITYNHNNNLYNGIVNQGCYNISDPDQPMVSGTFLVTVQSNSLTGPFSYVNSAFRPSTFNPHIIYDKLNNKYLLYFRINELTPYPICVGNISNNVTESDILIPHSMDIGISDDPTGPWDVHTVTIQNMEGIHISNPSGLISNNGTYIIAFRYNTNAEHIGIAISSDNYLGPYNNIANLSVDGEDPFIWQDKNDIYHIIFHVENSQHLSNWPSLHAYSNNLYNWTVSNSYNLYGKGAYSTNVTWDNGQTTMFYRRERPELVFDNNMVPIYLYTAVQQFKNSSHFGYSYSVVQAIN